MRSTGDRTGSHCGGTIARSSAQGTSHTGKCRRLRGRTAARWRQSGVQSGCGGRSGRRDSQPCELFLADITVHCPVTPSDALTGSNSERGKPRKTRSGKRVLLILS